MARVPRARYSPRSLSEGNPTASPSSAPTSAAAGRVTRAGARVASTRIATVNAPAARKPAWPSEIWPAIPVRRWSDSAPIAASAVCEQSSRANGETTHGRPSIDRASAPRARRRGALSTSAMSAAYEVLKAPLPWAMSDALELLPRPRKAPGAHEEHAEQAQERRYVGEEGIAVADREHLDGGDEQCGGYDAAEAVETADEGHREGLEAEDAHRGIE